MQNSKLRIMITLFAIVINQMANAQNAWEDHTYSYKTSETCKMKTDGGCWIVGYRVLEFEEDSVMIYDKVRGNCHPIDNMYDKDFLNLKTYPWNQINDQIKIDGFNDFEVHLTDGIKIIGSIKINGVNRSFEFQLDVE